ncbi:protein cramped-like isoform X1 [Phyllobates terribilis]|uniref:protein cramped-like isoform X1 n=2 Tax=Phyllobates terribilis TaxID=111132 RepID=UPI003CCAF91B
MSDPGRTEARRSPEPCMTVKLKSGEENKPNKRAPEAEEEEEEAAAAEAAVVLVVAATAVPTGEEEDKTKTEGDLLISETPDKDPPEASTPEQQPSKVQQDQHHFLRSSVRPHSKRQRKDSGGNGRPLSAKGKALDNATPSSPSCSTTLAPSTTKASGRNVAPSASEKDEGNKKKVRRQWESWSTEDKNTFFEALYEHGKDFEAIQNNIALKYKKKAKPASMVKNKEQVRHFYYRTWHKISKYIDFNNVFSCGLKKSSQELYGLICYGELRKKIGGCMDDKNAAKLNELIQLGATTVRYKGRNLRIKAPMCRALKKLCDPEGKTGLSDEEDQKPVRLPLKVPIELQPRNNQAWARVQSLAQNPRLRMMVELHRKVSSLIEFLKQKWALQEVRIRKSLDDPQLADMESQDPKEELYLFPPETAQLSSLPGVARVVHSKAHCTVHWQESGKYKQSSKDIHLLPPAQILGIQTGQGTARVQLKCPRGNADTKQGNKVEVPSNVTPEKTQNFENGLLESVSSDGVSNGPKTPDEAPPEPMDTSTSGEIPGCPPPDVEELSLNDPLPLYLKSCQDLIVPDINQAADHIAACPPTSPESNPKPPGDVESPSREKVEMATISPQPVNCTTQASGPDTQVKEQSGSSKAPKNNSNQLNEQLRQEGWNRQTSENLTLAEVYLMLGKPGKLQLEYEWMDPTRSDDLDSPLRHKQRLLSCLLRLIATELNPKTPSQTPETASVATSPLKLPVQDQTLTPPGKVITLVSRNPDCLRTQPAQLQSTFPPTFNTSGFRNLSRPLLFGGPLGSVTTSGDGAVFAVPTMLPPNSRHAKVSSPSKESEAAGRQHLDAISSDFFLPKAKKQRSRHLRKPLVVQRTLLPRPSGISLPHVCSFSILSNSSVAGRGSFKPIHSTLSKTASQPIVPKGLATPATNSLASAIDMAAKSAGIIPESSLPVLETDGLVGIGPLPSDSLTGAVPEPTMETSSGDPIPAVTVCPEVPFIALSTPSVQDSAQPFQPSSILSMPPIFENPLQNGPPDPTSCTPSSSSTCFSPPNVSALLDISLPGPPDDVLSHGEPATHISDSIIEIAISSGQYGEAVPLSPAKLNENSKSLPSPSSSPHQSWIASPSHDPQWYPNDSSDSSLSSLLSSFISPEKNKKTAPAAAGNPSGTSLLGPSLLDGSSRDSFVSRSLSDVVEVVDSQLACLMNENSIDYISRFNDLAQELSATEPARRDPLFETGAPGNGQPIRDLS